MMSESLKVFIIVAEKNNFSKAAKALNLTQPAISFQIQTLEQYYQTMLFDRVNRHVKLTEAGELLLEYAHSMSGVQAELERKMQQLTGHVKGTLLIGASRTVGEYILPYVICEFNRDFPDVDITMEIYNTQQVEDNILNRYLDIGVVESDVTHSELYYQSILKDELVLVIPPEHRWNERSDIELEELVNEPFIIREPGSGSRLVFEQALIDAEFDVERLNVIMEIGSITASKAAVMSGLGVTVLSKWAVWEEEKFGKLKTLPIRGLDMNRSFHIIQNDASYQSEACSQFVRFLGEISAEDIMQFY